MKDLRTRKQRAANCVLGNIACQIDASCEDCLDVFDLKQRCWTDRCVCHQSTVRAIREQTSPSFSRHTLMSYDRSSSRAHLFTPSLVCYVTECNRSLCGLKNRVLSYRDIIANAINRSALITSDMTKKHYLKFSQ